MSPIAALRRLLSAYWRRPAPPPNLPHYGTDMEGMVEHFERLARQAMAPPNGFQPRRSMSPAETRAIASHIRGATRCRP